MSRSLPPSPRMGWFQPGRDPSQLVVIGPMDWWYSHWDVTVGRSRRCGRENCKLCREANSPAIRYVLPVATSSGARMLLELREAQRQVIEELWNLPDYGTGSIMVIQRIGDGKRAKVVAEIVGHKEVAPTNISAIVLQLGLPPLA